MNINTIRRDQRGSALLEFALLLPVFLLIVLGSLSALWMLTARSALSGAAKDGARYASIRHDPLECEATPCPVGYPTEDEVAAYVQERAGRFDVEAVTLVRPTQSNEPLTVTVEGDLPVIIQSITSVFGRDSIEYTSIAKARAE